MHKGNILKHSIKNSYCLKKNTILAVDYLSRRDRSELDFGLSWGLCVSPCLLYRVYNITSRKRLWFFIPLQWSMKWSFYWNEISNYFIIFIPWNDHDHEFFSIKTTEIFLLTAIILSQLGTVIQELRGKNDCNVFLSSFTRSC